MSSPRQQPSSDLETTSRMTSAASSSAASTSSSEAASSNGSEKIAVIVAPFTGGPFSVQVNRKDSVEDFKKVVAKRLKVLKDRICLLYRESQLSEGSLEDNCVVDGSRITLLPRAETGLLAQRPEQSVMQALESLSDSQVTDFLSGKAPLNLTMRLGDHMMLIQLQLSTVNSSSSNAAKRSRTSSSGSSSNSISRPPVSSTTQASQQAVAAAAAAAAAVAAVEAAAKSSTTKATAMGAGSSNANNTTPGESHQYKPKLDTRALTEASKNLTKTLRQLSSEVLTTKCEEAHMRSGGASAASTSKSSSSSARVAATNSSTTASKATPAEEATSESKPSRKRGRSSGGAIIESMHHHGKGVYSGTFSGTLNPALQDTNGQPKRDITTIIHILNDLLCAQYKNYPCSRGQASAGASKSCQTAPRGGQHHHHHYHHHHHHHHHRHHGGHHQQQQSPSSMAFDWTRGQATGQTMEDQIQVTREKMEQLRRIMEERKAKRRARREARASPYSTTWSLKTEDELSNSNVASPTDMTSATSTETTTESSTTTTSASVTSTSAAAAAAAAAASSASNSDNMFNNNPELEPVTA